MFMCAGVAISGCCPGGGTGFLLEQSAVRGQLESTAIGVRASRVLQRANAGSMTESFLGENGTEKQQEIATMKTTMAPASSLPAIYDDYRSRSSSARVPSAAINQCVGAPRMIVIETVFSAELAATGVAVRACLDARQWASAGSDKRCSKSI